MEHIKVKDKDYLYRDMNSNCIVNMDSKGYDEYMEIYKKKYKEMMKIKDIESDLSIIHNELSEIKSLLRHLVNGS